MSITRRALLGFIFGAPLVCMTTDADAKPIQLVSRPLALPTTIRGINFQRIMDVADMFRYHTVWGLYQKGIRLSSTPQPQESNALYSVIVVPTEDFTLGMDDILLHNLLGLPNHLARMLKEVEGGKATLCGVECWPIENGIVYQMTVTQTADPLPIDRNILYSSWSEVIA